MVTLLSWYQGRTRPTLESDEFTLRICLIDPYQGRSASPALHGVDSIGSWYLQHTIDTYTSDPKGTNKLEVDVSDGQGNFNFFGAGFTGVSFRSRINGYMFANGPLMTMKKCERVRWYVVSIGQGQTHTPHWRSNVVLDGGKRTDVIFIASAQMETMDMVPDDPGTWMYHCHFDEHKQDAAIC